MDDSYSSRSQRGSFYPSTTGIFFASAEGVPPDRETASGLLDVAGFVWVKREHYFSPEYNPRVIACYQQGVIVEMSTTQAKNEAASHRRRSNVPLGTEAIPRFAPIAAALGVACAQQILEEFRKMLEGVDLRTGAQKKRVRKKS